MQKRELYKVESASLKRGRRFCPRCGPGIFLAEHENRFTCGRCKYTEFKKQKKQPEPKETAEKAEKPSPENGEA